MFPNIKENIKNPLAIVLVKVAGLWAAANAGYFFLFPLLGIDLSYNSAPRVFAVYFLVWCVISAYLFWDLFEASLPEASDIWIYAELSLICAGFLWLLLYIFSLVPGLHGPLLAPYSDILFATPWYFLPKSVEVLMQQILIGALVHAFAVRFQSMKKIIFLYIFTFGLAHVAMFLFGSSGLYATIMTTGAVLSAFVFPYLMLRVRGGFMYSYTIHLVFYIALAMIFHAWPPAGYGFL